MHYLILARDIAGDEPLRQQFEDAPPLPDLPCDLSAALLSWNQNMALQIAEVIDAQARLTKLNAEGQDLAERIAGAIGDGAKVSYRKE
jgi:hypothetical protein